MRLNAILRRMVRCLLPFLLTAALTVFAAPPLLVDNAANAHLTHVDDAGRLALGEGIDDASDKRYPISWQADIESTVDFFPVIELFPIHGSVKQRQVSRYDLEIYALNCKLII